MKKLLVKSLVLMMALCLVLSGCGGGNGGGEDTSGAAGDDAQTYTIRLAHAVATDHPSHLASELFKTNVEEQSGGRLIVELYPNGALGGERQEAEAVSIGTLEATIVGADAASGMIKEWGLIGLPYLFNSYDAAIAALDGEFGDEMEALGEAQNMYMLGWGDCGFRNVSNGDKAITSLADLKGLKIRVMENPIHIALFNALGANPTPIAFNELFTALQQKTVNGQENPITTFTTSKFYEVQKYMTMTGHVYTAAPFFINKPFFESLPEDLQAIVVECGAQWQADQRQMFLDNETLYLQTCQDNGMTVTELTPEQKQEFIDAADTIYPDIYAEYGEELINLGRSYNQ